MIQNIFQFDMTVITYTVVVIVTILLFLVFLASRYRKFSTNQYVIHLRGGKVKSAGLGGRIYLLPLIDAYIVIPTTTRQTILDAREKVLSREYQDLHIISYLYWKVIDPKVAYTQVSWDPRSPDYIESVLKTATEAILRTTCASMALEKIIRERDEIIEQISNHLHRLTANWGLVIESIEIKEVEVMDSNLKENMEAVKKTEEEKHARLARADAEEIARTRELEVQRKVGIQDEIVQEEIQLKHKQREISVQNQERERMSIEADGQRKQMELLAVGEASKVKTKLIAQAEGEAEVIRQQMLAQAEGFAKQIEALSTADERFLAVQLTNVLPEIFKSMKAEKMFIMGKGEDTFSSMANGIMPFLQLLPEFSDKIKQFMSKKAPLKALKAAKPE
jgi:flotillin